jgi:type III protein arginine methyltransferase
LQPLLRAGVPVRLGDPALSLDPDRLLALLGQLEGGSLGHLELELPVEDLDEGLIGRLAPAGVRALELDLHALTVGRADPERLRVCVHELGERQIACRGALAFGLPSQSHAHVRHAVDEAVQAELDDVRLLRLLVPPGSELHRKAARMGLQHAERPPYEVLAHPAASHAELMRSVRLAATLDRLRDSLPGTGLLRVLGGELGSAVEILEGFAESLAVDGADPLEAGPIESAERAFLDHLRRVHGIDLSLANGRARLQRSPLLAVRWTGDGRRLITDDSTGRVAQVGRHALALLDRFDRAQSAHQVCEQVVADVPPDRRGQLRREVQRTVDKLVSMSFLVPAQVQTAGADEDDEFPFTCLEEFDYHYRMLSDSARVMAYRRAIEQAIAPGQHAIEVGTGTGILAVLAAKAGARVTAIERFSVLGIARAVARQSGVDGQIEFIRGRSDLVRIEEPGDLLISEIVGNRILNEGLLETTLDARRRLLKPGARLIPEKIEILAEVGRTDRFEHLQREFGRVGGEVGVNLDPLAHWFQGRVAAGQVVWELGTEGDDFRPLADEVSLLEIDLRKMESVDFSVARSVLPCSDGMANAVVLAFRLQLMEGVELSTSGRGHGLHWSKPVFMLRRPLPVHAGQPVRVRATYEAHGELLVSLEPG